VQIPWTAAACLAAALGAWPTVAGVRSFAPQAQDTRASDPRPAQSHPVAPAFDPTPAAAVLVERHLATLGGRGGFDRVLDLELTGAFEEGPSSRTWRLLVRRSPFGVREEIGPSDAGAPPFVAVTDGDQAWRLRPDGTSEPLPAAAAIAVIENAFLFGRRYLTHARFEGTSEEVWPLEDWAADLPPEIERGPRVRAISLRAPIGILWLALFSEDGQLHGLRHQELDRPRWLRFGLWKDWEGVLIPMLIAEGQTGLPAVRVLRIERARIGVQHDPALFAGDPEPPIEGVVALGPLRRVPAAVPGSGYLAMPDVGLGAVKTWAYVDTGAANVWLEPSLARELSLPFLGQEPSFGGVQGFVAGVHWLDALALPQRRFIQLPVRSTAMPGAPDLGPNMRPRMILGGMPLFGGSPVFDLDGAELRLRGSPVVPLQDVARAERKGSAAAGAKPGADSQPRAEIARVPFLASGPKGPFLVEITIGGSAPVPVILDTGCPYVLRLSAAGLRRAGLPTSRAAWRERGGGLPLPYSGAGGGEPATDLLVRLDEIALGPVRWLRPWVLLAGLGSAEEATELWYEGLFGAGALFPFARFGLDLERGELELEPGAGVERVAEGRWSVPDPGQFLGLQLEAGQAHPDSVLGAPRVYDVVAGSHAARAGIRSGDRLLAIDGIPCTMQIPAQLQRELWVREGRYVALTFFREGRAAPLDVVLP
jgi:predicted aspartyl protease